MGKNRKTAEKNTLAHRKKTNLQTGAGGGAAWWLVFVSFKMEREKRSFSYEVERVLPLEGNIEP